MKKEAQGEQHRHGGAQWLRAAALALVVLLQACGADSDDSPVVPATGTEPSPEPPVLSPLDQRLYTLADTLGLDGDPALPGFSLAPVTPADDPMVKLGQLLFFSHTLSGRADVSCGSCHHPDFGGSDGLSLGVGVVPTVSSAIGRDRLVDPTLDLDPAADGGPNMHRNSITVFNTAFFNRSLTLGGRIFVTDDAVVPGGIGQAIKTPESGSVPLSAPNTGLLEVMSKFPMTNNNEMRGYLFNGLTTEEDYRERLAARLRGEFDLSMMSVDGPANWLALFRTAFSAPEAAPEDLITVANMQVALAAYLRSMVFIDTPWRRYLAGEVNAIPEEAKRGAELFYAPTEEGGLGCASCHSGDFLTDERFYNVGFPQAGRGFRRAEKDDIGRWLNTRVTEDKYAFRVPSLLNVSLTAPYGHAGTFDTLEDLLDYHADPVTGADLFDYTLSSLLQFQPLSVNYPLAEQHTKATQQEASFALAVDKLPQRTLTYEERYHLITFLNALSDSCAVSLVCRNQWVPALNEDPDGNLLVRNLNPVVNDMPVDDTDGDLQTPDDYPTQVDFVFADQPALTTFAEIGSCEGPVNTAALNTSTSTFVARSADPTFGFVNLLLQYLHPHGYTLDTWGGEKPNWQTEPTMVAGGLAAVHLDSDCWLDLVYTGGEESGLVFYRNRGGQLGFEDTPLLTVDPGTLYGSVAAVDINGDYRRELFFGNIKGDILPAFSPQDDGQYYPVTILPMSRHTYGMSFGDYSGDGYPDMFLAHWFGSGAYATAPALWRNGITTLYPADGEAGTSSDSINQDFNFTPKFVDMNADGHQDILLSSDFGTSVVLQNQGDGTFANITDRSIITDENGMGGALGDYDNDGDMDWFVTSVFDPNGEAEANWGVTGNKLYRNNSVAGGAIALENVSQAAGIADGNWGWGACFADFNNDGFLDIFHVNGFGYIPDKIFPEGSIKEVQQLYLSRTFEFIGSTPRLFVNRGDGTFEDRSLQWGLIVPSEGRGLTCFDYDRDGDLDVALLDHSNGPQFFSNQTGHGADRRFLTVRLVGEQPNTEALGAMVRVTADVGGSFGTQTMTRMAQANSNFNSQDPSELHFGLGQASVVTTLEVQWPDGSAVQCSDVAVNQFMVLDQRTAADRANCNAVP